MTEIVHKSIHCPVFHCSRSKLLLCTAFWRTSLPGKLPQEDHHTHKNSPSQGKAIWEFWSSILYMTKCLEKENNCYSPVFLPPFHKQALTFFWNYINNYYSWMRGRGKGLYFLLVTLIACFRLLLSRLESYNFWIRFLVQMHPFIFIVCFPNTFNKCLYDINVFPIMPLCSYLLKSCETQSIKNFKGSRHNSTGTQEEKPLLPLHHPDGLQHIGEMENVHRRHLCTPQWSRAQQGLKGVGAALCCRCPCLGPNMVRTRLIWVFAWAR